MAGTELPGPCALLEVPIESCCGVLAAMEEAGLSKTPVCAIGSRMVFLVRDELDESVGVGLTRSGKELVYWRSLAAFLDGRADRDEGVWLTPPGEASDLSETASLLTAIAEASNGLDIAALEHVDHVVWVLALERRRTNPSLARMGLATALGYQTSASDYWRSFGVFMRPASQSRDTAI